MAEITAQAAAQAVTLVRTAIANASNTARLNEFAANGPVIIEWVSVLDDVTTPECEELDGKQWQQPDDPEDYEGYIPLGHNIPFPGPIAHWNCRSTQIIAEDQTLKEQLFVDQPVSEEELLGIPEDLFGDPLLQLDYLMSDVGVADDALGLLKSTVRARDAMTVADAQSYVDAIAGNMGFDTNRIIVSEKGGPVRIVDGRRLQVMGYSFPVDSGAKQAGKIVIFAGSKGAHGEMIGTITHEIMHGIVDDMLTQVNNEIGAASSPVTDFLERFVGLTPDAPKQAQMILEDGFTDYSKSFWNEFYTAVSEAPDPQNWMHDGEAMDAFERAWNETLAEIGRVRADVDFFNVPWDIMKMSGERKPTKLWMDFYDQMLAMWQKIPESEKGMAGWLGADEPKAAFALEKDIGPAAVSATQISPVRQKIINDMTVGVFKKGTENASSGVQPSWIVELENGKKGIFKPAAGEDAGIRDSISSPFWTNEIAVSHIAEILGLNDLVPATVPRAFKVVDWRGDPWIGVGSFQNFVARADEAGKLPLSERFDGDEDLARAGAFDFLIGTTDRHSKNWMIAKAVSGRDKIALIDNGMALPDDLTEWKSFLLDRAAGWQRAQFDLNGFEISPAQFVSEALKIPAVVKEWDAKWPEIEAYLRSKHISSEAIDGVRQRLDLLNNMDNFGEIREWIGVNATEPNTSSDLSLSHVTVGSTNPVTSN